MILAGCHDSQVLLQDGKQIFRWNYIIIYRLIRVCVCIKSLISTYLCAMLSKFGNVWVVSYGSVASDMAFGWVIMNMYCLVLMKWQLRCPCMYNPQTLLYNSPANTTFCGYDVVSMTPTPGNTTSLHQENVRKWKTIGPVEVTLTLRPIVMQHCFSERIIRKEGRRIRESSSFVI